MHERQIENLLKQSPEERLAFFVRYSADFEVVWGLSVGADNWVVFRDGDGDDVFPIWPHEDLADACCFEEHRAMGAKPQLIELEDFLSQCIPDMIEQQTLFGVFYDTNREGIAVDGDALKRALEDEVGSVWE